MENLIIIGAIVSANILMAAAILISVVIGFRMGRRTIGEAPEIKDPTIELTGKQTLDSQDIFSEHVNDGPEGESDERIGTI